MVEKCGTVCLEAFDHWSKCRELWSVYIMSVTTAHPIRQETVRQEIYLHCRKAMLHYEGRKRRIRKNDLRRFIL